MTLVILGGRAFALEDDPIAPKDEGLPGQAETQAPNRLLTPRDELEAQLIAWRRHFHANPELANREFKTAEYIEAELRKIGFEDIRTKVGVTGIVATLRGAYPGPTVALRADMDGLPVLEQTGLPFASKARGKRGLAVVPVMHACGHDAHMAIALGAAKVLMDRRDQLHGNVKFIFQPAEEGPPPGEEGGSRLMIREGALENPKVDVIFGLHVWPAGPAGHIYARPAGTMASSARLFVTVKGQQTHGAVPFMGVDPIVVASQVVLGLQTIISRQVDNTPPSVISIGRFEGLGAHNIIPDEVKLVGTIRTLNIDVQEDLYNRVTRTARRIAEASGARADVEIERRAEIVFNDPDLFQQMEPTLMRVAGEGRYHIARGVTASEDFAFYQKEVP
ncbi:MAG: amidohydrolase, partial [Pseudomonadota bacterium]